MKRIVAFVTFLLLGAATAAAAPIRIVAAENFYGDVARQVGGDAVEVVSILSNPDQDPHLFEASPSVARDISDAAVVVYNGVDYDPWMEKLLAASPSPGRTVIVAGDLIGAKAGDNPHIWYNPNTILATAKALTATLTEADPTNAPTYAKRLEAFVASLAPVQDKIAQIRRSYAGTSVAATEPVFGYMFEAMGMDVKEMAFQMSVMNDTEPSVSDVAAFEDDLKSHRIKLLIYNSQATDPLADKMSALAKEADIPVVGATETQPEGKSYQEWMTSEIEAVGAALARPK